MARGRAIWLPGALFVVLAILFYAPLVAGVAAFPDGDFVHHFFPFSLYQYQSLVAGQLAVWNPYTYSGHPFLADVQAAVFYPLSNLLMLFTLPVTDAAARFYWLQIEAVMHTALAGWFAYLWTRDLTGSRWGGLIGGICFAFSGYVTGYAPLQLAVLRTAVWLPLLLWTLGRGWHAPHQWRWWWGSTAAVSAALLAGHSQTFLLLCYASFAWCGCLMWSQRPLRWQSLWATGLAAVLAVGVTAAQWLPSVEFVRASVRAEVDYTFVSGGLALADYWQLLLPRVLTQYAPLYIGVVGMVLVVAALFTLARPAELPIPSIPRLLPWKLGIGYCLGLTVFALLAALGGNGPIFPLLYRFAPGWSWFRGQERAAFLVVMGLSGLAAYGMAALDAVGPQVRRRMGIVAGALVVGIVYAFGLLWQLAGRTAIDHVSYLMIAGVTLLFGMATVVLIAMARPSPRRNMWIIVLAMVNLVWANAATNQMPGSPADRVQVAPEILAVMEAVDARGTNANGLPPRVYNEYRVYDDYGMRAGVEDVWGSSPLRVARYASLFEAFPLDRMWRLLGVEHVLTWRRELFGPSDLLAEFPQAADTTYLHRLPAPQPRAWVAANVDIMSDEAAWARLADHAYDLDLNAVIGEESRSFAPISNRGALSATVTLARLSPAQLVVDVQSDADALLIISETWLPGWEVSEVTCGSLTCPEVDGAGRAYFVPLRADLTLVGVWVPVGETRFILRYAPDSLRAGIWISSITLLILAIAGLWHWRRGAVR